MKKAVKQLFGPVLLVLILSTFGCSGGSGGASPPDDSDTTPPPDSPPLLAPDTSADPVLPEPGSAGYADAKEAARFLMQASFGPTAKTIDDVMDTGYEAWIDAQMAARRFAICRCLKRAWRKSGWPSTRK